MHQPNRLAPAYSAPLHQPYAARSPAAPRSPEPESPEEAANRGSQAAPLAGAAADSEAAGPPPALPRDYNTGAEAEGALNTMGVTKSRLSIDHIAFLGLLAGIWMAYARMFAQRVAGGVPADIREAWPVVPSLLTGATFPVGIVFVVLCGGELFNGNTMIMAVSWLNRKVTFRDVIVNWTIVLLANFVGCALAAYLAGYLTALFAPEPFRSYVVAVATHKVQLSFFKAFLLGIPGNALVCLSIFLGLAVRDITGKV
ncbi:hypothetical protein HDU88_006002 [Geranomyces variabilis]|nr:hypothetical protein HDU88_006002 [Geranomyces variabilis]